MLDAITASYTSASCSRMFSSSLGRDLIFCIVLGEQICTILKRLNLLRANVTGLPLIEIGRRRTGRKTCPDIVKSSQKKSVIYSRDFPYSLFNLV